MAKNKTSDDIIDELIGLMQYKIDKAETAISLLKLLKSAIKKERHRDAYGVK